MEQHQNVLTHYWWRAECVPFVMALASHGFLMTCLALQIWFQSYASKANLFFYFMLMQNYFSCFFPLPIVISSLRWGLEASRKTVVSPIKSLAFLFCFAKLIQLFLEMPHQVATVLLLFTLSGPVKASTYLVSKVLPYELVGSAATLWLKHPKLTICHISLKANHRCCCWLGCFIGKANNEMNNSIPF
jgi:hypothetical protein